MKPLPEGALLILGTTLGLMVGRNISSRPDASQNVAVDENGARVAKRERPARTDAATSGIDKIRKAKPDELPSLTRNAIHLSDPVEMRRQLTECLLHMDASNWQEVVEAFAKLSHETGRDQAEDWKLSLFRSGQVAGEQAMNLLLKNGLGKRNDANWHTLYGWSTKEPQAALAWLRKAEADGHPASSEYYAAVIAGAALTSPKDALKLLGEVPADRRGSCVGDLTWNVVQSGGVEALDEVLQFASKLDKSDSNDAALAANLFSEATDKLLWKADYARDVNQGFDVVIKLTQYGHDPNTATMSALQKYQWYYMPDKLNLLNNLNSSHKDSDLHLPTLTSFVLGTMNGDGDRVAVVEWMKQHPDSPLVPIIEQRVPRSQ